MKKVENHILDQGFLTWVKFHLPRGKCTEP